MKTLLMILLTVFTFSSFSGTKDDVTIPDSIEVDGKKLVLNGMTTRTASRFGVTVNVYVGGLYLESKETDADKIMASKTLKQISMNFVLFRAPKSNIKKQWKEQYAKLCGVKEVCKKNKLHFKVFLKQIKTMVKKDVMTLTFREKGLSVAVKKKKKSTNVEIASPEFANIILKIFLKSDDKKFSQGLLKI